MSFWTVYLDTGMQKCMSGFSAFVPTTGNILFRSMPNGNCLFNNSASLSLVRVDSLAHKFIMVGKFFFSRTMFELACLST